MLAQVLARRAFVVYLHQEIALLSEQLPKVTQPASEGHSSTAATLGCIVHVEPDGMLALRPGVKVHMYCSSPPCGAAAIFPREGARPTPPTTCPAKRRCTAVDQGQPHTVDPAWLAGAASGRGAEPGGASPATVTPTDNAALPDHLAARPCSKHSALVHAALSSTVSDQSISFSYDPIQVRSLRAWFHILLWLLLANPSP